MTETTTQTPRAGHNPSECGNALTIITPIKKSPSEVDALRALLQEIGADAARNPIVPFAESPSTHFARWVIIDTPGTSPLLAFESNYDGSLSDYLDELFEIAAPGLGQVYSYVEGDTSNLKAFLVAHQIKYQAFYRAYPERSVADVLLVLEVRSLVLNYLDANRVELKQQDPVEIHREVREMLRELGIENVSFTPVKKLELEFLTSGLQDLVGPPGPARDDARRLFGFVALGPLAALTLLEVAFGAATFHIFGILAGVLLAAALFLAVVIHEVEAVPDGPPRPPPLEDPQILEGQEDVCVQNQLTHIAVVKPGAFRNAALRAILYGINTLAHKTFVEGNLGGIPSIHFARWALLDDGRLLFFSNFDGSWDSYLGDFIDKASSGLSSIWSNTEWFPKTEYFFWKGAQDGDAFKRWTRERQLPMQVWYTAYPRYSVQNIRKAFQSAQQATADLSPEEAASWLAELG